MLYFNVFFSSQNNKPSIQLNTNLKIKLAHIHEVVEAEMSVVIEVVERIKMETWVFKCFFCVSLFSLL